MLKFTKF